MCRNLSLRVKNPAKKETKKETKKAQGRLFKNYFENKQLFPYCREVIIKKKYLQLQEQMVIEDITFKIINLFEKDILSSVKNCKYLEFENSDFKYLEYRHEDFLSYNRFLNKFIYFLDKTHEIDIYEKNISLLEILNQFEIYRMRIMSFVNQNKLLRYEQFMENYKC